MEFPEFTAQLELKTVPTIAEALTQLAVKAELAETALATGPTIPDAVTQEAVAA